LLLSLGDGRVLQNFGHQITLFALVQDPGLDVEGLGGDPEGLRKCLEDFGRWFAQASLDLGKVRVRDAREIRELAQG
jgi:hypothetical protein